MTNQAGHPMTFSERVTHWLTVTEAAEHIRAKDTEMLRGAIKAGELPAYRYGKASIRLKADEVDAWLEARPFEPKAAS